MQGVPCGTWRCDVDGLRYIASYPDLILALGADAAAGQRHFTTNGQLEGRNPCRFDVLAYLARYPDLQAAFGSDVQAATQKAVAVAKQGVDLGVAAQQRVVELVSQRVKANVDELKAISA